MGILMFESKNGNANIYTQQPGIDDFIITVDVLDSNGNTYHLTSMIIATLITGLIILALKYFQTNFYLLHIFQT